MRVCVCVYIVILISGWVTLSESKKWIHQSWKLPWPDVNTRHFKAIVPCTWICALMFWSRTHAMSMCFSLFYRNKRCGKTHLSINNGFRLMSGSIAWYNAERSVLFNLFVFRNMCHFLSCLTYLHPNLRNMFRRLRNQSGRHLFALSPKSLLQRLPSA